MTLRLRLAKLEASANAARPYQPPARVICDGIAVAAAIARDYPAGLPPVAPGAVRLIVRTIIDPPRNTETPP